jgi:hypothetical protein
MGPYCGDCSNYFDQCCCGSIVVEKRLVKLIGGPMDGYDYEIGVRNDLKEIIPGPHHRRGAGCTVIPLYIRSGSDFVFSKLL